MPTGISLPFLHFIPKTHNGYANRIARMERP